MHDSAPTALVSERRRKRTKTISDIWTKADISPREEDKSSCTRSFFHSFSSPYKGNPLYTPFLPALSHSQQCWESLWCLITPQGMSEVPFSCLSCHPHTALQGDKLLHPPVCLPSAAVSHTSGLHWFSNILRRWGAGVQQSKLPSITQPRSDTCQASPTASDHQLKAWFMVWGEDALPVSQAAWGRHQFTGSKENLGSLGKLIFGCRLHSSAPNVG